MHAESAEGGLSLVDVIDLEHIRLARGIRKRIRNHLERAAVVDRVGGAGDTAVKRGFMSGPDIGGRGKCYQLFDRGPDRDGNTDRNRLL